MAPAAVPALVLGTLQQSLRSASECEPAGDFAVAVLQAVQALVPSGRAHLDSLCTGTMLRSAAAFADCVHFLTVLHGQVPSLFELASAREDIATASWLREAGAAFDHDRRWLARLNVVTGSALDLQGLTAAEQLVRDQREALLTLAKSSRTGCALGAAVTLVLDWQSLRSELPKAANAIGIDCRDYQSEVWPSEGAGSALVAAGADLKVRRAIAFGAAQLASLHGQLFALLEARHAARLS